MPSNSNIVVEWLRSLQLGQYAESFIDNGYDDLEICKQVGEPDLDAIGVLNPQHRQRLLHSVRTLREEGAASVYFTLEEAAAAASAAVAEVSEPWPPAKERPQQSDPDQATARYRDEYEEGKAELVKIPRVQLRVLLRDQLAQDGIRLSLQPYSTTVSFGVSSQLIGLFYCCVSIRILSSRCCRGKLFVEALRKVILVNFSSLC